MAYKFKVGDNCSWRGRRGAMQEWAYENAAGIVRRCSRRRAMSGEGVAMCLVWFTDTDEHRYVRWTELVYEPPIILKSRAELIAAAVSTMQDIAIAHVPQPVNAARLASEDAKGEREDNTPARQHPGGY